MVRFGEKRAREGWLLFGGAAALEMLPNMRILVEKLELLEIAKTQIFDGTT